MIFVMMPAVPAFAGDLKSDDALGTRAIMEFQYESINRGGKSIYEIIAQAGFNPMDYIRFYNLRNYDRINASGAMYVLCLFPVALMLMSITGRQPRSAAAFPTSRLAMSVMLPTKGAANSIKPTVRLPTQGINKDKPTRWMRAMVAARPHKSSTSRLPQRWAATALAAAVGTA
jgi:hypothetical protein